MTVVIIILGTIACDALLSRYAGLKLWALTAVTSGFLVLFGPILLLLWTKENIQDHGAKALLKFCWSGLVLAGAVAAHGVIHFLFRERPTELKEIMSGATGGVLALVLFVSSILVIFVALSFLRLGVKVGLNKVFGEPERNMGSAADESNRTLQASR